ncbi:MAG: DUF1461 domain-containing protein [Panacagrimonas sp.]
MRHGRALRRLSWGLCLVVGSFYLSWRALAAVDFAYPVFHELIGIDQTIQAYGPRNRLRPGFHTTSAAQREDLFAQIARAVRHGGNGLARIRYANAQGRDLGPLLTRAEIVHLQDVAQLVGRFERVGLLACVLWIALSVCSRRQGGGIPGPASFAFGVLGTALVSAAVLLIFGPTTVFYFLHELLFPPHHQWFFYYQESLMSMMMRAPVLFGAIGALWAATAILLSALIYLASRKRLD